MGVFALDSYVLILRGNDVLQFINGLSTNKVNGTCTTVFTTIKAKIIDMCDVIVMDDFVALIGHNPYKESLLSHLKTRILDSDVSIGDASFSNEVFLSTADIEVNEGVTKANTFRGFLIISPIGKGPEVTMTEEQFSNYRVDNMIPHHGHEITPEFNPLDCGLGHLVHDNKGCYIGQEIIARMRSRNKQLKQFVRVSTHGEDKPTTVGENYCLTIKRMRK
ncbi:MAG: hypothetical protein QGI21_03210 [Candidatus Poseidoniaceae archaeon]|jgi:folate-binding protein YgfZ|nr:hypothetical protein [Candidatus Poseidoniaceae archaeon]